MNLQTQPQLPACFGKDWDKNAPECSGGPDPSYVHPQTGQHVREKCDFFSMCGARTQASRVAYSQAVIPPQNLIRPPVVTPPPVTVPQNFGQFMTQQQAQFAEAQRLAAMSASRPVVPVVQTPVTMVHPASTYQLNYQMPAYLSVPEERQPGESIWSVLGREILRSMFKATGHAVAHHFDARKLK